MPNQTMYGGATALHGLDVLPAPIHLMDIIRSNKDDK